MFPQALTLADDILTGFFTLTAGLTLIDKPDSWLLTGHDMLGIELWSDAEWSLSWSPDGDSIVIPADTHIMVNVRKLLVKTVLTIPGLYVTGTSDLNLLAHRMAAPADLA